MENLRKKLDQRKAALSSDRSEFFSEWQVLSDFYLPRRGRFLKDEKNKTNSFSKIINSTGTNSANVLANGMHTGLTNPARPWFRFGTKSDPNFAEFGPMKHWLSIAEKGVQAILHGSNFYNSAPQVYKESGVFGTGCTVMLEDYEDVIRNYVFTAGEYMLGVDHRGLVDTLYREYRMTVGQMVNKFGIDNVSLSVRNLYEKGSYDQTVPLVHVIEPNDDRLDWKMDSQNMPIRSAYYEVGGEREKFLRISGFEEKMIMAPRWDVLAGDSYGSGPGIEALGDNKQVQHEERKKGQAIDKHIDPPLSAPSAARGQSLNSLPGGVTYYDAMQGGNKIEPIYHVTPQIQELRADIAEVEERIKRAFHVDMFLMIANTGRQITATEVAERHEEKLIMLGPVIHRFGKEFHEPSIRRAFNIGLRKGLIPPPPEEMVQRGEQVKIEYISLLAQAQQAVATGSIERLVGFAGNLVAVKPDVLDKLDLDQGIDEYASAIGAPPSIVRSDEDVAVIREERAKAEQQQQQMEMVQQAADGAKTLSEVQTGEGRNLIQDMLNV